MKDYAAMGASDRQQEYKRLHRRLIIPNILILAIAVVAALSLIFGTTLELRVHIDEEIVSSLMEEMSGESTASLAARNTETSTDGENADGSQDGTDGGNADGSQDGAGGESTDGSQDGTDGGNADEGYTQDMMAFMLKGISMDLKLKIEPKALLSAAANKDKRAGLKTFFEGVTESGFAELQSVFTQMAPNTLALIIVQQSSAEGVDYAALDTQGFAQSVTLLEEQKTDEAKASFLQASADFAANQLHAPLTAEQLGEVSTQFDNFVAQMRSEDGTVDFGNLASSQGEENIFSDLTAISSTVDTMDESTVSMLRTMVLVLTILVYGCAGLWAVLAVFALLHILLPNKKVAMWYVKLTGFLPCLLFFVLPMAATSLLPKVLGDLPSIFSAVSFGSLAFISGICYLAMWVVSIFFCHPVKKRIKACKRAM